MLLTCLLSPTLARTLAAQVRKKRFTKLQEERGQWAGKRGRKTENERRPKAHHRPKH